MNIATLVREAVNHVRNQWNATKAANKDRRFHALMVELEDLRVDQHLTREQADWYIQHHSMMWQPLTFHEDEVAEWSPGLHEAIDVTFGKGRWAR